jgi:cleavage stimulation factor subunit 3
MYNYKNGSLEEASEFFEKGMNFLKNNILLHFAAASFEETRKNTQRAKEIFQKLLTVRNDSIIYIQYQKLAIRLGEIEEARNIYINASKSPNSTYHVEIASALMEFYTNKTPKIARKVFEVGLKKHKYINEPTYIIVFFFFF